MVVFPRWLMGVFRCLDFLRIPIREDRIHVANGTLFLNGEFRVEKEFCRNRLPIRYDPSAPQPETWLRFLSDLLEAEDILTLQEYLGYCLIPTNRGQVMMLLKGNGGEGKSRIGVVMQKLLMTLLLVERYDIYDLSCLARMRPEDVAADLAALKRKGYLQGR